MLEAVAAAQPCWLRQSMGGKPLITKIAGWVVVILIVVWIISDPSGAGADVHGWINDIISFFTHLAHG